MTGRGRCQRREKSMAGGRDTAGLKKSDKDCSNPKLEAHITEKPLDYPEITKPALYPEILDLYSQARKALSFRSPFDSEDSLATQAAVSSANNLPTGVSNLLSRHSDNRKRHKKLHYGKEKKSSTSAKTRGSNIWIETEEYFRDLILDDVERLEKLSSLELSNDEKCFLIPILDECNKLPDRDDTLNGNLASACEKYNAKFEDCVGSNSTGMVNFNESYKNGRYTTDDDGDGGETKEIEIKPKHNAHNCQNSEKRFTSFSGLEWLLGSRSKMYLASERPSKKRKLLRRDAGLEKLLIARPVEGLEAVCHYCSYGDMGNPLNCLIKCSSCEVVVHQRCYGVQDDVDNFWLCSWCKWKNVVDLSTETPCLLCPRKGGALKPVGKRGPGSENECSKMEFAHLFCCLWMQEVYLENTRNMELIMNMDELKDAKRKLICSLCKVKYGACVRCSNGSCRTSFHPSCAREASHRLEIWGKLGSDEVELRCFCSKHSEVKCDSNCQDTGDTSLAGDSVSNYAGEHLKENEKKMESYQANGDVLHPLTAEYTAVAENEDVNASSALKCTSILKKLIHLGEVNAEVVTSEIGVFPDSLSVILADKHIPPDLQCKLVRWLKNHAHVRNWQKNLKQKIRSLVEPKDDSEATECTFTASVEKTSDPDAIPVKSIPHHRRTKSSMMHVRDGMSCTSKDKTYDDRDEGDADLKFTSENLTVEIEKMLCDTNYYEDIEETTEAEVQNVAQCFAEDDVFQDTKPFRHMTSSPFLKIGEVTYASDVHPLVYRKFMEAKSELLQRNAYCESAVLRDRKASSISGLCCNNHNLLATSADRTSRPGGVDLDQLVFPENQIMLKLSPADEVEGELIYYQQRLFGNAFVRRHISDELISRVVRSLPRDIEIAGRRKWDAVLVNQYNHNLREAKKQGRKERRHKEAQAVLAAATAAAAASSRISSTRKDNLEDSSQQEDLRKINVSDSMRALYSQNPQSMFISAATRSSSDRNPDLDHFASGISRNHATTCAICSRCDTVLNPILVCSRCKVSVHLDCYRSVKNTTGPWHCELCEDLISSRGSGALAANSWEKAYFVPECSLCGGTAGAFRKSSDGQWMHALCAEWILESTYRRGQVNLIKGKDIACRGADVCIVCHRRQGVCLKCSYGHCQTTFHPNCARSSGFYMTVRTNSGKLQHKAYCEKHSVEQRAKADNQRHGIEEFKSLKQVRVELERLRLLCERIVKREKLKRDLVLCSHDVLAASRDSVLSALARHPFYQPEVSSESATTSLKGHTDGYRLRSEMVQRSDDITFDRTVAGKRRVRLPVSLDSDQKTDDSSSSQNLHEVKPVERASFSGKQVPQRLSHASRDPSDAKFMKHAETFEKELLMTSDQASMKNQRLPKGFVYVPIRCLSNEKETIPDACSPEPAQRKG